MSYRPGRSDYWRRKREKPTQEKLDLAYCQLVWDKIPYKNKKQTFSKIVRRNSINNHIINKFLKIWEMGGSSSYKMPGEYIKFANINSNRPQDFVRPTLDMLLNSRR